MKRGISILLVAFCLCFIFSFKAKAAESLEVKANIKGTVEKGNQIEILVDISETKSLYAASFYFKYDSKVLKIEEIIPGELISDNKISKFEALNNIDEAKGLVSYGFTCMGNINGFSGKGNLIKLKATVLDTKDFKLTSKYGNKTPNGDYTVTMQICDKNIEELPYNFEPFTYTAPKIEKVVEGEKGTKDSNKETSGEQTNTSKDTTVEKDGKAIDSNANAANPADSTKDDKDIAKQPKNNNPQGKSGSIVYILGGIIIISLGGFGYFRFKKKK